MPASRSSMVLRMRRRAHLEATAVLCVLALALLSFMSAAVLWAGSPARAQATELVVGLGQTTGQISGVRNISNTAPVTSGGQTKAPQEWAKEVTCVRYSPDGGAYTTTAVDGASGKYAAVGYGKPDTNVPCPNTYEGEPPAGNQSSMGFLPGASNRVKVGEIFLVGTMRYFNQNINVDDDPVLNPEKKNGAGTTYYGDLKVTTASGQVTADFPWVAVDSANSACYTQLDEKGEIIIAKAAPTKYAADETGKIGPASVAGPYKYAFNDKGQVDKTKAIRNDPTIGGLTFGQGMGFYDKKGRDCSWDELRIKSDRSQTAWTDPNTGIKYKLRLWGFVNNNQNATCPVSPAVAMASLEQRFVTVEGGLATYGCLYGSMEQVRPVTLKKVVEAPASIQASTTIPTFTYDNVSTPGSYGAEKWGKPAALKPSGWGESGAASDPTTYELLAPNDAAKIKENQATPKATDTSSGWTLGKVTCTYSKNGKTTPLMRRDGKQMDTSDSVDLNAATIRLDQAELATSFEEAAVTCTWHNQYTSKSHLTLVNQVVEGTAQPTAWILTATPVSGLVGQKTVTGTTGTSAVTNVTTGAGDYDLSTSQVEGYEASWACVRTGTTTAVPVTAANRVSLPADSAVTCTAQQKLASKVITFTKALTGATDGTNLAEYQLNYSCAKPGKPAVAGKLSLKRDGSPATSERVPVGATCTITEDTPGGLLTSTAGTFTWHSPIGYAVKNGNSQVTTTAAGDGVSFTVPAEQGDLAVTVTNKVVPHAGITKTFDRVEKVPGAAGTPDTFKQTYTVKVTNPSRATGLKYSLQDALSAPTGTTVNSVTVTGGDAAHAPAVNGAAWTVTGADLAAGATHSYTAVVNVTAPDAGLPGATGAACNSKAVTDGLAIRNLATLTTEGDAKGVEAAACGSVPANPRFSVSKKGLEVTRDANANTFTAAYEVTIANTSHVAAKLREDVLDLPGLPASATISKVEVREGGAVASTITDQTKLKAAGGFVIAAKDSGSELAAVPAGANTGGGTRVLNVQVTFKVDAAAPGHNDADYQCGHQRADGKPSGLYNAVSMTGDTSGEQDNNGCLSTAAALRFSKSVQSPPGPGITFTVAYDVTVVNEGALPGSTGTVTDKPAFAPGLTITGATVARDGAAPQPITPDAGGAYTLTTGQNIASGATTVWHLVLSVRMDPAVAGFNEADLACAKDAAGAFQPGHGLFNQLLTANGVDKNQTPGHNVACTNANADAAKRPLTIIKTGSQGNLEGADFDIYPTDPTAAGAKPLAGSVTAAGDKGVFTVSALTINREYWLVETKAPAGHVLLAHPVKFRLGADGAVEVLDQDAANTATVVASYRQAGAGAPANGLANTLTVRDVEAARLPLSGGTGLIVNVLIGAVLVGAGGLLAVRSLTRGRRLAR